MLSTSTAEERRPLFQKRETTIAWSDYQDDVSLSQYLAKNLPHLTPRIVAFTPQVALGCCRDLYRNKK